MIDHDQKQLGKILWEVAGQLRGAMNADEFRDFPGNSGWSRKQAF